MVAVCETVFNSFKTDFFVVAVHDANMLKLFFYFISLIYKFYFIYSLLISSAKIVIINNKYYTILS